MTDDLVAFLRARLDEDEQAAKAATAGPWRYNPNKVWNLPGHMFGEEFVGAGPLSKTIGVAGTGPADDPQSMSDARHIARHDPARLLREVEAKRQIIETCCHYLSWTPPVPPRQVQSWALASTTLQHLALPYADHPDYRDEWRP